MKKNIRRQVADQASLVGLLLVFVLPFAVVVYQLIAEIDVGIEFAQKERLGIKYNHPLRKLLEHLIEHRYLASAYLNGNTAFKEKLILEQSHIEDDIKIIDMLDSELSKTIKTSTQWIAYKGKWQTLKSKLLNRSPQENFDAYTVLIEDTVSLIAYVGDISNLILDPVLDSYYLMDTMITKLPPEIAKTAQARDLGIEMLTDNKITAPESAQLTILSSLIKAPNDAVDRGIKIAFNSNSKLRYQIVVSLQKTLTRTNNFIEVINKKNY